MSTEVPYPTNAPVEHATVSYSVKELLEQIKAQLDRMSQNYDSRLAVLERQPPTIVNGEFRLAHVETEVAAHKVVLTAMDKADNIQAGGVLFKDRVMTKLVGLASVMGIVAGITFQLIQILT